MDITRSTFPFYARYFHPITLGETANLFDTDNLAESATELAFLTERFESLRTQGICPTLGTDVLIPLEGTLYRPSSSSASDIPLVLIGHGNARSYFVNGADNTPASEFLSFKGYQVTQEELARNGIASFSINLNVVNALNSPDDTYRRIQIFLLHLLLLKFLAGESIAIPDTDAFPILFKIGSDFTNLDEALVQAGSPSSDAALTELKSLKDALNGKFDFSNLGFMGHSRGASAVCRMFELLHDGTGPGSTAFPVTDELVERILQLVVYNGNPNRDHIKCILALQPDESDAKIESIKTLFAVVAGTHDEDVGEEAINIYEKVKAPRVMFLVNGATHKRFNSIWRSPVGGTPRIEAMIAADPAVRILSNRRHDQIARKVFPSFFIATLKNRNRFYRYFTREANYSFRVKIQRAWNFGMPPQAVPASWKTFDDDLKDTPILNANSAGAPDQELPFETLDELNFQLDQERFGDDFSRYISYTDQVASAFMHKKDNNSDVATLTIPIDVDLNEYTHFSFRIAKWYKVRNTEKIDPTVPITGIPRSVDLKNFAIRLYRDDAPIGRRLFRGNFRKVLHRAYPTLKRGKSREVVYYWDTSIVLQSVEVHKSEFNASNDAELSTVNKIVIELTPSRHLADDEEDIFVLNDFTLTKRDFTIPAVR